MGRARRSIGGAVAVGLAVGLLAAGPAAAAPGTSTASAAPTCAAGRVCSWSAPGFAGSYSSVPVTGCTHLSMGAISTRRSAVNGTGRPVLVWERLANGPDGLACQGRVRVVGAGAAVADFGFTAVGVSPLG
jgi:peptidase inhibitor family I36